MNDLCTLVCDLKAIAHGLVSYGKLLRTSYKVKCVMILSVINRDRCGQITSKQFRSRAYDLNKMLEQIIDGENGIYFVKMKGFSKKKRREA